MAVPAALASKLNLTLPEISKFFGTDEALHKSSLSRSTHRLVQEWLETCQTRHGHCNHRYCPSWTPVTRSLVEQWLQSLQGRYGNMQPMDWVALVASNLRLDAETAWNLHKGPTWLPSRLVDFGTSSWLTLGALLYEAHTQPSAIPEPTLRWFRPTPHTWISSCMLYRWLTSRRRSRMPSPQQIRSPLGNRPCWRTCWNGSAKNFQSTLGSEYLAGLWQDNLPHELIWRISRAESDTVRRPSKYRAPSWSWASVETQMINRFVERELLSVIAVTDSQIDHL